MSCAGSFRKDPNTLGSFGRRSFSQKVSGSFSRMHGGGANACAPKHSRSTMAPISRTVPATELSPGEAADTAVLAAVLARCVPLCHPPSILPDVSGPPLTIPWEPTL